jgi:hypothetical protein
MAMTIVMKAACTLLLLSGISSTTAEGRESEGNGGLDCYRCVIEYPEVSCERVGLGEVGSTGCLAGAGWCQTAGGWCQEPVRLREVGPDGRALDPFRNVADLRSASNGVEGQSRYDRSCSGVITRGTYASDHAAEIEKSMDEMVI